MEISQKVRYIGVDDYEIDLFEGQYPCPSGMAYNSYIILDKKIAVMDSVDKNFGTQWLDNLKKQLQGKMPDYLIVQHMEPDHSANIARFATEYPSAKIVASKQAFVMMKHYFSTEFEDRRIVVQDGDRLDLGEHALVFFTAPMVHWPEVIVSFEERENILFSADAFGKFGGINTQEDWACEARRYYFGIVGKFGVQVQNLLKKLSALSIKTICPLHGPVLKGDISKYFRLYDIWSKYEAESDGVFIAYTSVYGNTLQAVEILKAEIEKIGVKVSVTDLARCDFSEAVEDAFRYGRIVLASTTYNGGVFPFMRSFLHELVEHNFQNRRVGLIENGSWAPFAARTMRGMLENCKNLDFCQSVVRVHGAVTAENQEQIRALAKEVCE
jgi:flavorubredoxin